MLRRIGLLTAADGGALLRVLFCLGAPALIFLAILQVDLDASFLRLCLFSPAVTGSAVAIMLLLRRSAFKNLDARTFGPLLTGVVVLNTGFLFPFVERIAGAEGIARLAVIDALNAVVVFSLVYGVVVAVAHDRPDPSFVLRKLALAPPLWGVISALVVKAIGGRPPAVLLETFEVAAGVVSVAVLAGLGLKFEFRLRQPRPLLIGLVLRFGLGAALGAGFVTITGLDGVEANVAMFLSVAPVGINTLAFAEMERLDVDFAASFMSMGLLLAVIASPLTVQLLL